jgi:hypothetical protein
MALPTTEIVVSPDWYLPRFPADKRAQMPWADRTVAEVDRPLGMLGPRGSERVLNLACGINRHSLGLSRRGSGIVGLDISEELAEIARAEAEAQSLEVSFVQADLRELDYQEEFDLVLSLNDGLVGYFEPDEENYRTFEVVARPLRSGGGHLMQLPNVLHAEKHLPQRNWIAGEATLEFSDHRWNAQDPLRRRLHGADPDRRGRSSRFPSPSASTRWRSPKRPTSRWGCASPTSTGDRQAPHAPGRSVRGVRGGAGGIGPMSFFRRRQPAWTKGGALRNRISAFSVLVLILGLLVAGCGSDNDSDSTASAARGGNASGNERDGSRQETQDSTDKEGAGATTGDQEPTEGADDKLAFIRDATTICKAAIAKILAPSNAALGKASNKPKAVQDAISAKLVSSTFVPELEAEIGELRSLPVPPGDNAQVTAIMEAIEKMINEAKAEPENFVSEYPPSFTRAANLATDYGIEECPYG